MTFGFAPAELVFSLLILLYCEDGEALEQDAQ